MVVETDLFGFYYSTISTFNPPLVGMVVETPQPSQWCAVFSFNPPLVGMVVETTKSLSQQIQALNFQPTPSRDGSWNLIPSQLRIIIPLFQPTPSRDGSWNPTGDSMEASSVDFQPTPSRDGSWNFL